MVPKQAPQAPSIIDTPPTPIEPQDTLLAGHHRSRSLQFLDTLIHPSRSRSSSASSRHSRSPDKVKDVIANIGLAAGSVGADHTRSRSPMDENLVEGVKAFLSALQSTLRQTRTGTGDKVETIEVGSC